MNEQAEVKNAITGVKQQVKSYSGYYQCNAEVFAPADIAGLQRILAMARQQKRKVSFRGEGYSFDSQGLNNDLLISLKHLNKIEVNPAARQVTVGAGANWRNILKATSPYNLIPAIMVSTGHASAGGTISANCMSRFSPVLGKEGKWIEHFLIVTANGEIRRCSRTENADLFYATIGGFGYLGAVVEITHNLYPVPENAKVKTVVIRKPHHHDLYKDLLPDSNTKGTIYSAFGISGEQMRTMTCLVEYRTENRLKQMAPHRPDITFRLITEFMVQWFPTMGQLFWNYAYAVYTRINDTYIDPVDQYTFFMDGNVRAKVLGRKLGMEFRAVQQTFVIPANQHNLNYFLSETLRLLRAADMPPAMIDTLYLPHDDNFPLSSTYNLSGYALSMAFEALNPAKFEKIKATLEQLSAICLELKGKVHLTKNVLAKPEHIQAMYSDGLPQFFATKKKYDPGNLFTSHFIERIFPDYVRQIQ